MKRTPLKRGTSQLKRTAISRKPSQQQREHIDEMAFLRLQAFSRDQACVLCGNHGYRESTQLHAHHRKPRGQGGSDTLANLVTLCAGCHQHVHEHPLESYAANLLFHSWDEPPTEPWTL